MRERKYFYGFYLLQAAAISAVLVPFFRSNNLLEWDFPGHYAAIWYLREYLLPWATGWNPFFYCGYPQGTFYPPLGHYVAALMSFGVGTGPAMKILLAAALLVLPVCFYRFARRWGLDDLQSAVCATWMTAILFIRGELLGSWNFGSDIRSILVVGLFANSLSLPVLFAFFATFGELKSGKAWKWPAALLGVLLLLHPVSSLVAGLFVLAVVLVRLWERADGSHFPWKALAWPIGIGSLVGCAWVLPFVFLRNQMAEGYSGPQWSIPVFFIVLNGLTLAIAVFRFQQMRTLSVAYIILANFILVGSMWQMSLEFSRLTIYLLLFAPVFLLVWVRSRPVLLALSGFAVILGFCGYKFGGLNPAGVPDFPMPDFGRVPGRILAVAPPSHLPSFHVHHDLIALRTGNASILGLFIQSSPNGRFLGNLTKTIDPNAHVWGTPGEVIRTEALGETYPAYVRDRLRLFDIRHIYTDLRLEDVLGPSVAGAKRYINSYPAPDPGNPVAMEELRRRYNTHGAFVDFYLYTVGPGTLAEPLSYVPGVPGTDWKLTTQRWFLETRGVPIFTDRPVPAGVRPAQNGESVELLDASPRMDQLKLRINAANDIPVLVKVGYFPTWRLTLNGRPAPVYRASPNLLLVFGHGEAVLELRRPWQEYAGLALSLAGLALLLLL